jgi:hypothetical protein
MSSGVSKSTITVAAEKFNTAFELNVQDVLGIIIKIHFVLDLLFYCIIVDAVLWVRKDKA